MIASQKGSSLLRTAGRALALITGLTLTVGVATTGCSRRHIGSRYGVAVKLAAERQAAFPNQFVAERPAGLEPGDTNLVLDNYYATLKSKTAAGTTQTSTAGQALTGAGVGGNVQGAQGQ